MAATALNSYGEMNWGSDSEDDDFNPVPASGSNDESGEIDKDLNGTVPAIGGLKSAPAMTGDVYKSRKFRELTSPPIAREEPRVSGEQGGSARSKLDVRGLKRPRPAVDEVVEVDDGEDEEEEEADEDEPVQRKHKKRKERRNQFIDIEAEVDDDDEDIDEDEDELEEAAGFIADDHPDDAGQLQAGIERDDRHHLEFDRIREQQDNLTAEQLAEEMAERARQRNRTGHTDSTNLSSRYLMPGPDDPGMWMIKCRSGREKEIVREINNRAIGYEATRSADSPEYFPIISAFERDKIHPGHIYVECMSEQEMMQGFIGMIDVYPTVNAVKLSQKDMPAMLRVKPDKVLEDGQYVRIKGKSGYQRDLAQITAVFSNGVDIEVKLVPRPRPHEDVMKKQLKIQVGESGVKARMGNPGTKKDGAKYPQLLLTRREAERLKLPITASDGTNRFQIKGDAYDNGFLVKIFKINQLDYDNIKPTLEEAVQFSSGGDQGTQRLDLKQLSDTLKESETSTPFVNGDEVEVYDGEQKGVKGEVVEAVSDTVIRMQVTAGGLLGETLEVQVKNLRKVFEIGQHVKVISGANFKEEMGMIVKIKDNLITFTSDTGGKELTVFSKDLTGARDTGQSAGLSPYSKHDLVSLDMTTVGCVISVGRDLLQVLDQNGSVQQIMPSRISNNLTAEARRAIATDANGQSLKQNDMVKEKGGERRTGRVIHLHRTIAFVLSPGDLNETDGLFVIRTNFIESLSITAAGGANSANLTQMNPSRGGAGAMLPPNVAREGRDRNIGKNVRVKKGGYKGLMGIIKDVTGDQARIELHTKNKIVTINVANLTILDANGNPTTEQPLSRIPSQFGGATSYGAAPGYQGMGSRTPAASSATPAFQGGRTPHWGVTGANQAPLSSRTPAWQGPREAGARTSAEGMSMGQTAYGGGGGATSYGGARTPAYGMPGGQTAYGGGNQTAYGGGGQTSYGGHQQGYSGATGNGTISHGAYGGRTPAQQQPQHSGYTGTRTPAHIPAPYGQSDESWAQETNGQPGNVTARTPGWQSTGATVGGPTPKEQGSWGGGSSTAPRDEGPRYADESP